MKDSHTRLQAEEHPLVLPSAAVHPEQYCLHLIHEKAYETAAAEASHRRVLDLGCNTGYGTSRVRTAARCAVGVDVSRDAIGYAARHYATDGLGFVLYDGGGLPFGDDSFDLVTSFQVIEHVPEPTSYLAEIRRVLAPAGTVIFTTPNAAIRLDPGMQPWNPFHVREFTADELSRTLQPWFGEVSVRGLFADPVLYATEYERCQASRKHARRACHPDAPALPVAGVGALKARLRSSLPGAYGFAARVKAGLRLRRFRARYSTSDLFYREDELDAALDLMAICRGVS